MKKLRKLMALGLVMMIMLQLTACGKAEPVSVRVGALKGATTLGLLDMKSKADDGSYTNSYEFSMATAADEIAGKLIKGELDIALIPANLASVLYSKTEGKVSVIDINTLGVLYVVSRDSGIKDIADLKGRTVYLTGKGTTPDYVFRYVLSANGIVDEVTLEYKSEATEVASVIAGDETAVGLLPQPFATATCLSTEGAVEVLDMNEEWNKVSTDGACLVTGVTVVRNDFLGDNPDAVKEFLEAHRASAEAAMNETERIAPLAVEEGIIPKEPIALKAIPKCNIVCLTGTEMKNALSGYLSVLYDLDPTAVGGSLPGDDFYKEF